MSLPRAFTDELRVRVTLSDLIGKRTKLIRAGREFKGCCPFHKEKTPSFTVNDVKGFYHCFGCGAHGDAIEFLMKHDNMTFMDAVEQLASIAGMQVPKPTPEDEKKYKQQASLYDLMECVATYFQKQLFDASNKKIQQYLKERGITSDSARIFRLGFMPQDDSGLKQTLSKAGFKTDDAILAGIFKKSEKKQGEIYSFFRNRVMFPVFDLQGRVVAFGGRVLPERFGGPADKSAPKYINSPETPIFHKGRMLYGLSHARKPIGDGETVIVVEGYMDVIALVQAGFKGAVAPLGTALTETQVETVWKVMPEGNRAPILCFDGDAAGQRAAARALDRILPILKPDHTVRFAFLPTEHDPDSLIKAEGARAMERVLKNAIGAIDMMWDQEVGERNLSQPEAKAGLRAALEKKARGIVDTSVQKFFIHDIFQRVEKLFLSKKSINSAPSGRFKTDYRGRPRQVGADDPFRPDGLKAPQIKSEKSRQVERAKVLLALMIHYPELFDEFGEAFGIIPLSHPDYAALRQSVMDLLSEQNNLDYQAVKQHLTLSGYGPLLESLFDSASFPHARLARPDQPVEDARQAWRDVFEIGFKNVRTA